MEIQISPTTIKRTMANSVDASETISVGGSENGTISGMVGREVEATGKTLSHKCASITRNCLKCTQPRCYLGHSRRAQGDGIYAARQQFLGSSCQLSVAWQQLLGSSYQVAVSGQQLLGSSCWVAVGMSLNIIILTTATLQVSHHNYTSTRLSTNKVQRTEFMRPGICKRTGLIPPQHTPTEYSGYLPSSSKCQLSCNWRDKSSMSSMTISNSYFIERLD